MSQTPSKIFNPDDYPDEVKRNKLTPDPKSQISKSGYLVNEEYPHTRKIKLKFLDAADTNSLHLHEESNPKHDELNPKGISVSKSEALASVKTIDVEKKDKREFDSGKSLGLIQTKPKFQTNRTDNRFYTHKHPPTEIEINKDVKIYKIKNKKYKLPNLQKEEKMPLIHIVNYSSASQPVTLKSNIKRKCLLLIIRG